MREKEVRREKKTFNKEVQFLTDRKESNVSVKEISRYSELPILTTGSQTKLNNLFAMSIIILLRLPTMV